MLFPQSVRSDQPLTCMALRPVTPGADIPDIKGLHAGPDLNGLEQTPVWTSPIRSCCWSMRRTPTCIRA